MSEETAKEVLNSILGLFLSIIFVIFIGSIGYKLGAYNNPSALDVYRGNTTLQITYKDSIPIDSVVVWKNLN